MPLYDYQCLKCGIQHEEFRSIAEMREPEKTPCVECGGEIQKFITPVAISYAGAPRTTPDWFNDRVKGMKQRYGSQETQLDSIIKH